MKLVRVGNMTVLPMETIPWADYEDDCEGEDGEIAKPRDPGSFRLEGTQHKPGCEDDDLEMRDPNNIPPERNHDLSKHCRQASGPKALSNGCPGRRDSSNGGNLSRDHLSANRYRTSNTTAPSNDVNRRAIAPRVSSSRCYAPRDQHKSATTEESRDASSRGNTGYDLRSPSKGYDDRIRGAVQHREMGANRFVGTKRLGRETALCEASECKRHSRGDSSQQHRYERGFWRVDKKLGGLDLRHTLNQRASNRECGVEGSRWRREAPASVSVAVEAEGEKPQRPKDVADNKGSSEDDRCADHGNRKQYEIFASLLFKDSDAVEGSVEGIIDNEVSDYTAGERPCDLDIQPSSPRVVSAGNQAASRNFEELASSPTNGRLGGEEHSQEKDSRLFVDVTNKFTIHAATAVKEQAMESDPHRLSQRQRQVDFGKNTLGYERYVEIVPRWKRSKSDPRTPNPRQVCSKRSWDGQIRKWRRLLHAYDPPLEDGEEVAEVFTTTDSTQGHMEVKDAKVCSLLASRLEGQKPTSDGANDCGNDDHESMFRGLMTLHQRSAESIGIKRVSSRQDCSQSKPLSSFQCFSHSKEDEDSSKSCEISKGLSGKFCAKDEAEFGVSNMEIVGEEALSIYENWMES